MVYRSLTHSLWHKRLKYQKRCWLSRKLRSFSTSKPNISEAVSHSIINNDMFWKCVTRPFRCINVNWLRVLAKVSTKLQKMHFFRQFKDHKSERKHGNWANDPIFSSTFSALTVCNIHFWIWKYSKLTILVCKIPQ